MVISRARQIKKALSRDNPEIRRNLNVILNLKLP